MIKKILNFSDEQIEFLNKLSQKKEISFTEAVRRIIDEFIEKQRNTQEIKQ